jgi:hypothetical protein
VSRKSQQAGAEAPGHDSFLDIVANLVGILIILVMVVGVRAKDAMLDATPAVDANQEQREELERNAQAAVAAATAVESDIHQLGANIKRQDLEIDYRRKEREKVQLLVAAAEEVLANERNKLDESEREAFDASRELIAARDQLAQLEIGIQAAANAEAPVAVIEHLPTPMAKTVFGEELHVQLKGGRLTIIPWEQLVGELQREAPHQLWRLKDQDQMTETLGPVGGFWMKYTLKRVQYEMNVRGGTATRGGVELDQFILIPVTEDLGEPFDEAFREGAQFHSLLARKDPQATTVTAWVYPDSFDEFRQLKQRLFQRGFLAAARPLPADQPIGGSPRGTRSAAQ